MRRTRLLLALILGGLAAAQDPAPPATPEQAAQLRALLKGSPRLPIQLAPLAVQTPAPDWSTDYVSSTAAGRDGTIYLLHRNLQQDPVVALDRNGRILRSWGRGLYTIPHSVRIDPQGNVWTVDAGSSVVLQFTPQGKQLLRIDVGEMPEGRSQFRGTADIAFAAGGRIFVADGYGNARVLEYNHQGKRVRQWGEPGIKPGQFHLPHGIATRDNILYVADRENGRIQRFDLDGRPRGEWNHLGKTFSLTFGPDGHLWIGTQPRNVPNGAEGWLVKVDRTSGKVLGYLESPGFHSVDVTAAGEALTGARSHPNQVLWFRRSP
jgi:DNA-binding beta-propeller fold protein YncE